MRTHWTWVQVLGGRVPRRYGELPPSVAKAKALAAEADAAGDSGAGPTGAVANDDDDVNWFDCIAPSPLLEKLNKLRKPLGG